MNSVDHPEHYNRGGEIEENGTAKYGAIKLIEAWGMGKGFCKGNALKYLLRAPYKGERGEDLRKALWYIERAAALPDNYELNNSIDVSTACEAWELSASFEEIVDSVVADNLKEAADNLREILKDEIDVDLAEPPEPLPEPPAELPIGYGYRRRLTDERKSLTHHFMIGEVDGYVIVGFYDDGTPGELFIHLAKQGSTVSCLADAWATAVSIGLQHGMSISTVIDKFSWTSFEPAGLTGNEKIPMAKSALDYVARWLGLRFGHEPEEQKSDELGEPGEPEKADEA